MLKDKMKLKCSEPVFMVIFKLTEMIRMGCIEGRFGEEFNKFQLDDYDTAMMIYDELALKYGRPEISFEYNESEGMVINITN